MKTKLACLLGWLLLYVVRLIGYGKEGVKARKQLGKDEKDDYLYGLLLIFPLIGWGFSMILLFSDIQDGRPIGMKLLAWCVGIPAVFVGWIIWARRAGKRFVEEAANPKKNETPKQPIVHQKGDWCCPRCRLILDKDISVCYRCKTPKKEAVDFIS